MRCRHSAAQTRSSQRAHRLHFGIRGGDLVNIVAFVKDPKHEKLGGHTGPWAEERPREELLADFAGFTDECLTLLRAVEKPSIWGIWSLDPPIDVIMDGALLLVGDAAHATTPHHGAGAGQAVEDALFASRLLSDVASARSRHAEVLRALDVYYRYRHARAQRVQRTSREAGLLYEFLGVNGEGDDVDKLAASLRGRIHWIWDYDVAQGLECALAELHRR